MESPKFMKRFNTLLRLYPKSIGTIQTPHHDSERNLESSILCPNSASVISYDRIDKKHPSASVLMDIERVGSILISVTDDEITTFKEYGYY